MNCSRRKFQAFWAKYCFAVSVWGVSKQERVQQSNSWKSVDLSFQDKFVAYPTSTLLHAFSKSWRLSVLRAWTVCATKGYSLFNNPSVFIEMTQGNTSSRCKARENACDKDTIGFGLDSHWLWNGAKQSIKNSFNLSTFVIPKSGSVHKYINSFAVIQAAVCCGVNWPPISCKPVLTNLRYSIVCVVSFFYSWCWW